MHRFLTYMAVKVVSKVLIFGTFSVVVNAPCSHLSNSEASDSWICGVCMWIIHVSSDLSGLFLSFS